MIDRGNEMMVVGLSFVAGCLAGVAGGLLYAPQSGVKTRRQLTNFAGDVREKAEEATEQVARTIDKVVKRGRSLVHA